MVRERFYPAENGKRAMFVTERGLDDLASVYETCKPSARNDWLEYTATIEGMREKGADEKWYGGLTKTSQAVDLVREGWKDGLDKVNDLRNRLAGDVPTAVERKRKPVWADDGDDLDVDRALAGQWDSAYRTARRAWSQSPTVVEIVAAWGGNCDRSAEELLWSGAAMAVATDILENAGYSVRLTAAITSVESYGEEKALVQHRIAIKDAGETLRADAIAGVVCHAGVFRTLGFRVILSTPTRLGEGLGSQRSMKETKEEFKRAGEWFDEKSTIIIDSVFDRDSAVKAIKQAVGMAQGHVQEAA